MIVVKTFRAIFTRLRCNDHPSFPILSPSANAVSSLNSSLNGNIPPSETPAATPATPHIIPPLHLPNSQTPAVPLFLPTLPPHHTSSPLQGSNPPIPAFTKIRENVPKNRRAHLPSVPPIVSKRNPTMKSKNSPGC